MNFDSIKAPEAHIFSELRPYVIARSYLFVYIYILFAASAKKAIIHKVGAEEKNTRKICFTSMVLMGECYLLRFQHKVSPSSWSNAHVYAIESLNL